MTDTLNYTTSLEELIFSSKNKEYGAYNLRKSYKTYLTTAMWIVILITITGTAVYRISSNEDIELIKKSRDPIIIDLTNISTIEKVKKIQDIKIPPKTSTIKFTPPVVMEDEMVKGGSIPTIEELQNVNPGLETVEGVEGGYDNSLNDDVVIEDVVEKPKEFFTWAEEMPVPIGGTESIMKKITYPEIAKRAGIEGKVIVLAYVDENGSVTKAELIKSISAGCDEEALDAVLKTKFKPGRQNGKPVSVKVMIPIIFKLQ